MHMQGEREVYTYTSTYTHIHVHIYRYIYIYIQEAIDGDLDAIVSGLASLRGLAEDIHSEVKVQAVMIDEIAVQVCVYSRSLLPL